MKNSHERGCKLYLAILPLLACLSSCGGGSSGGSSPLAIASVSVSCNPASVQTTQTSLCSATVIGTGNYSSAVTWSVNDVVSGNSTVGDISASGLYTAPASVPSQATVTVKATSNQDASKVGTSTITVTTQSMQTSANPAGPIIIPSVLVSGQQTPLILTSFVVGSDSSTQVQLFNLAGGIPLLVGTMGDNGQAGDQVAGDHVYTISITLTVPNIASLPMRIVASTGTTGGTPVDFSVPVVQISSYATNTDLNQAETQIFNTATQTRGLISNVNWENQVLLHNVSNNLISMFAAFSGVVNQNAALQSAMAQTQVKKLRDLSLDTVAGTAGDILTKGLLSPAQDAASCDLLVESLGGFRDNYPNALLSDDPRLQQFAQELAAICSTSGSCQGAFTQDDFLDDNLAAAEWAHEYIVSGQPLPTPISGCSGGITQSLASVAVKAELQQFTDLAGDGLATLANLGHIASLAVGQSANYLIGWWVDSSGNQGATIAQVAPNETFAAPTGTYNLAASFGGDTANGTITNTPVYPNSTTVISPSPGVSTTVTSPFVTGLVPAAGPVGTVVSIIGTGFDPNPSGNQVTFNRTAAQVSGSTPSSIQTTVPIGAVSGPITVTTSNGTTSSSLVFTVSGSPNNPIPSISSLSPSSLTAGLASHVLTINGTDFLPTSSVTFNGVLHTAIFESSSQLEFTLSSNDLAVIGSFPVIVTNPSPAGGASNTADFVVTSGAAGTVTISPETVAVPEGGVQTFNARVVGSSDGVIWSVLEGSVGGTIVSSTTATAVYWPPSTTGTFHVVATNADNSAETAVATVTVSAPMTLTVLHTFQPTQGEGADPVGSLIQAKDGDFYGATYAGGSTDSGTIFKLDALGNMTVLYSFPGPGGGAPDAGVIQAADGDFYGTTFYGGDYGRGTAFKMDNLGNVTTLHSFSEPGAANPYASLIQANDGSFYGTTYYGGSSYEGTAFRMDASGNVTLLHSFSGTDGAALYAGLVQASDGNFYGTTYYGGAPSACTGTCGTVFKMDSLGNVTVLHSFSGPDGVGLLAGLIQANDGNFYGTTSDGGASGSGTVFRIDASGNLTILHAFSFTDGSGAYAGLIQGSDGNFYGTTSGGGRLDQGTIFRMDSQGNVTVLHSFSNADAGYVTTGVIQGTDGSLYGTGKGGSAGSGVVYRLDLSAVSGGESQAKGASSH